MKPIDMGDRRELFCDTVLWQTVGNAFFQLHRPQMQEIALRRDTVADNRLTSYYNILFDGKKYAMYYTAHGFDKMCGKWPHQHICRAESIDGIHWAKPSYGIYEFMGSKENNIIYLFDDDILDNFCAFYDTNPACPENEKYKAVAERVINDKQVLNGLVSADGIHWNDLGTVLTDGAFDTLNTCYYDEQAGEYRAFVRSWERHEQGGTLGESGEDEQVQPDAKRCRTIVTATSKDFRHWTGVTPLDYGASPCYQMYANNISPYFRAPHIFLGFPTRYYERMWCVNFEKMAYPEKRRERIKWFQSERTGTAISDGLFMTSRDGVHFIRHDDMPIFPGGIEGDGNWIYGDAYPAHGMVVSPSPRVGEPDEISMFVPDNKENALRRCTLRLDGFISLHTGMQPQTLLSHPLTFTGERLEFNFTSTAAGGFTVQIEDEQGNPIPGYTLAECDEIFGDSVSRTVTWGSRQGLSDLAGRVIRIRIYARETDFYSFCFCKA